MTLNVAGKYLFLFRNTMFIFIFIFQLAAANESNSRAIVNTSSGLIQGYIRDNPTSESGATFFAFQGIPFAQPPVGELRFMPPVKPIAWEGILDTTEEKQTCFNFQGGIEDCLYLNVFTNQLLNPDTKELKPVMCFIHGGAFLFGAATYNTTQPELLLNNDVVLVVINYRVNVFGFLNVMEEEYLGNVGLRDQIAALEWIQENIRNFGGDPNKVTIFGQSAGGASVQYLVLSPLSEGLFHQAIAESGSTLNVWAYYTGDPRKMAFRLGTILDIYTNNSKELIEKLQKLDASTLFNASVSEEMFVEEPFNPLVAQPFEPSIEPNHSKAFITKSTYESLEEGEFQHIPFMTGYVTDEGSYGAWYADRKVINLSMYDDDHELLVPSSLNLEKGSSASKIVTKKIMQEFFSDAPPSNRVAFINYMSEELFDRGIRKAITFMCKFTTVYQYYFTYQAEPNPYLLTTGHGAELSSLFYVGPRSDSDALTQKRMTQLWTNFAKTGNPTPEEDPLLENIIWKKCEPASDNGYSYLHIDKEMELECNLDNNYYNFWENIFGEYGNPPYYIW